MAKEKLYRIKQRYTSVIISVIVSLLIGILLFVYTSKTLDNVVRKNIMETAKMGAAVIYETNQHNLEFAEFIGEKYCKEGDLLIEELQKDEIFRTLQKSGLKNIYYISELGKLSGAGNAYSFSEKYSGHLSTVQKVIAPFYDFKDGSLSIAYVTPIFEGTDFLGTLILNYDILFLSDITDTIRFGDNGNTYILTGEALTIAHDDRSLVISLDNDFENIKTDPILEELVSLGEKMIQGDLGSGTYHYRGLKKFMGFAPIKGTDWSIAVASPYVDIFQSIDQLIVFLLLALGLFVVAIYVLNLILKRIQLKLEKEKKLSQDAIDVANILILKFKEKGLISYANYYVLKKLGFRRNDLILKKTIFELADPEYQYKLKGILEKLESGVKINNFEISHVTKTGEECYILWNFKDTEEEGVTALMGIDITERVKAEKELLERHVELTALYEELTASQEELSYKYDQLRESDEKFNLILDASNIGIWEWDLDKNIRHYSERWKRIFGHQEELVSTYEEWKNVMLPEYIEEYEKKLSAFREEKADRYEIEYQIEDAKGEKRWVYEVGKALWSETGELSRLAGSHADITNLKNYQQRLEKMAYFDSLTELPNRAKLYAIGDFFLNSLEKQSAAFLYLDFDNFKIINDTLGHSAGDYLLTKIGERLLSVLPQSCMLFRLGGDEFVIFIHEESAYIHRDAIIKTIFKSLEKPFIIDKSSFYLTISMGISQYPNDGHTIDELLKNADIAMYYAKDMGKNRAEYFNFEMNQSVLERQNIENQMRTALKNKEMMMYYQPQINLNNNKIEGFEALIRWKNPELGFVSPEKFIKIAEENKQILEIGDFVLDTSFAFAKKINENLEKPIRISVNLSVLQILEEDFLSKMDHYQQKYGLKSEWIGVELTETVMISNFELIEEKLKVLKNQGIQISLDDFGKGYSSLSYLLKLPIDVLKIDRVFISGEIGITDKNLTESIIQLGQTVGLQIVAEGVETEEQLRYISIHGCDFSQGYYHARPLSEADAILKIQS